MGYSTRLREITDISGGNMYPAAGKSKGKKRSAVWAGGTEEKFCLPMPVPSSDCDSPPEKMKGTRRIPAGPGRF